MDGPLDALPTFGDGKMCADMFSWIICTIWIIYTI
jgi:hypothetical protein